LPKLTVDGKRIRLYTPREAGIMLGGVTPQTIGEWRRGGWIEGVLIANTYFYTREALEECAQHKGLGKWDRSELNVEVVEVAR